MLGAASSNRIRSGIQARADFPLKDKASPGKIPQTRHFRPNLSMQFLNHHYSFCIPGCLSVHVLVDKH